VIPHAAIAAAAKADPIPVVPDRVAGRVLHADGDYFAYACGSVEDPGFARQQVNNRLHTAMTVSGAEKLVIHLSAGDTHKGYRREISTIKPYQGHRSGKDKPANWYFLRDYLEGRPEALLSSHREADDSIAEACHNAPATSCVYTADKDMRMLPGIHIDWKLYTMVVVRPDDWEIYGEPDEDGDAKCYGRKWFWLQMLHGDSADNIPGLEHVWLDGKATQCGPVTARNLLAGLDEPQAQRKVMEAYHATYGNSWGDRFAEQAGLLWLRRTYAADIGDFLCTIHDRKIAEAMRLGSVRRLEQRVKERIHAEAQSIGSEVYSASAIIGAEW